MAKVIFKDIAARGNFIDFCSANIENADVFDVFSFNSGDSVGRIRINRSNSVFDFCNRSGFSFNKLIETVQAHRVVPGRVLVGFGTSVGYGKDWIAKILKHDTIPFRLIAQLGRCGS